MTTPLLPAPPAAAAPTPASAEAPTGLAALPSPPTGMPTPEAFQREVDGYIDALDPKKRKKALITQDLFDMIRAVLLDPSATKGNGSTAQDRHWIKKEFRLDPDDDRIVLHAGKVDKGAAQAPRLALKSELFDLIRRAHAEVQHCGRDKTFAIIKRRYSHVPKELVAQFVKLCPTCDSQRDLSKPSPKENAQVRYAPSTSSSGRPLKSTQPFSPDVEPPPPLPIPPTQAQKGRRSSAARQDRPGESSSFPSVFQQPDTASSLVASRFGRFFDGEPVAGPSGSNGHGSDADAEGELDGPHESIADLPPLPGPNETPMFDRQGSESPRTQAARAICHFFPPPQSSLPMPPSNNPYLNPDGSPAPLPLPPSSASAQGMYPHPLQHPHPHPHSHSPALPYPPPLSLPHPHPQAHAPAHHPVPPPGPPRRSSIFALVSPTNGYAPLPLPDPPASSLPTPPSLSFPPQHQPPHAHPYPQPLPYPHPHQHPHLHAYQHPPPAPPPPGPPTAPADGVPVSRPRTRQQPRVDYTDPRDEDYTVPGAGAGPVEAQPLEVMGDVAARAAAAAAAAVGGVGVGAGETKRRREEDGMNGMDGVNGARGSVSQAAKKVKVEGERAKQVAGGAVAGAA
ncbi:hypothetical protein JCM10207_003730 [Rhodosporidiobolus poonsookiae]